MKKIISGIFLGISITICGTALAQVSSETPVTTIALPSVTASSSVVYLNSINSGISADAVYSLAESDQNTNAIVFQLKEISRKLDLLISKR